MQAAVDQEAFMNQKINCTNLRTILKLLIHRLEIQEAQGFYGATQAFIIVPDHQALAMAQVDFLAQI